MNLFSFSSFVALSLVAVAGCAASTEESAESLQDNLTARPVIELATTRDPSSVQAQLFTLLETFKNDAELGIASGIESAALTMNGAPEAGVRGRTVTCDTSRMEAVAPGGGGFSQINFFGCVLQGFDQVRNGGVLPSVVVPFEGDKQLAGKLVALLAKGEQTGGLGVKKTGGKDPGCCDIPSSVTYTIGNDDASLSCTLRSGGFAAIQRAECTFLQNDTHAKTGN
jgi:hypothetical protein